MVGKVLDRKVAEVFEPLLEPARYKGVHGGRGSGKSHFFAEQLIEDSLAEKGLRSVCIREVQKSLKESAKRLLEDKLQEFGLGEVDGFKVFREVIETPGGGIITFQGMQDHTAESIKSLEGFGRAWAEEAQTLSERSLTLLRPTIRAPGSQMWFSWNPRRPNDPVDKMLRGGEPPTGSKVIRANWSDNPWFPSVLHAERLDCLKGDPDQYGHIWEGEYASIVEGAYFANALREARTQGRIGFVPADPLMQYRAYWDIGVKDATAIWIAQFIDREIRVLDYYEAVGQPLSAHLEWLRSKKYGNALCVLPHDGSHHDVVTATRFEDHIRAAGFDVETVANQGKGAALKRIEAARRLFPSIRFNEATCKPGLDALGWYHEKRDEVRNVGLGPEHDWSSHGCFLGETEVLTRYGTCQIKNLPETGEVLTPCGWKQYILPRITKRNAPLVEVQFTDGYSVRCTPDHLFLTDSGWKSAESLTPNTVIQSTLTKSRSISTAASIVCGRAKRTYRGVVSAFIGTLGRLHSALSQRAAISTIETATYSTTASAILSASPQPSTCRNLGQSVKSQQTAGSRPLPGTRQPNGMRPRPAASGTSDTPNAQRAGPSGSVKKSRASIAASFIWRWSGRAATLANSALRLARAQPIESAARQTNTHVAIANVRHLNETADVWDITVPDGHWFSLANGAVVHNSDAFGLMCVAYEEPRPKRRREHGSAGAGSWMA